MTKRIALMTFLLLVAVCAYATVTGNLKYELGPERVVVSCLDHKAPTVHVINPVSGPIVVVSCEREKP